MKNKLMQKRLEFTGISRELQAVSPLQTLARGYSITADAQTGKIITDSRDVLPGTQLRTRLESGELVSVVEETNAPA